MSCLRYDELLTTPPAKPATTPCPKCRRPLADGVKRCIYCGHVRILAAPGTPEYEAERAAAEAEAKKLERQKAIYQAGMGLGKASAPSGFASKLREQSLPIRILVMVILVPLLMVTVPFKAFRVVKDVFRP
jgi:hypothetical protein